MDKLTQSLNISLEIWGGIFCLLAALAVNAGGAADTRKGKLLRALLLESTILSAAAILQCIYENTPVPQNIVILELCSLVNILTAFRCCDRVASMIDLTLSEYAARNQGQHYDRRWYKALKLLVIPGYLLGVINLMYPAFTGYTAANEWYRAGAYPFLLMYGFCCCLILTIELIAEMKQVALDEIMGMLLFCFLPIIGMVIDLATGIRFMVSVGVTLGSLLLFLTQQIVREQQAAKDRLLLEKQKEEISELTARVTLSQVRPHFLYNSLTTIQCLCDEDPKLASEAIRRFADYLRNNLGNLQTERNVPFAKELEHVKTYLWLEQLRFGEDLQVEYEIETVDFELPALTIQALAENAVTHGLMKKHMGGHLKISSRKEPDAYEVLVEDDGQGFDMKEFRKDYEHGIADLRSRLAAMCGGNLEIDSAPEAGTRVRVTIPMGGLE